MPDNKDTLLQQSAPQDEGDTFVSEEGEEYEMTPEAKKELEDFEANATILIHSEETRDKVLAQLKVGGDPIQSVADTVYNIFKRLESSRQKEGDALNQFTMVMGAEFIVNEIIDIGMAAGVINLDEKGRYDALQKSVEKYVHMGLKHGTIDPIALQEELIPMMKQHDPEAYEQSVQLAQKSGIPMGPPGSEQSQQPRENNVPAQSGDVPMQLQR